MQLVSRIHGLTPRGRILRRVDRFLRCLQEELSEINASAFNASLIELRSIKTLKLNLSAPFSPLSSHFVWQLYSKFKFLPIHRSSPSRQSLPLTCSTHLSWTASIFALHRLPFISDSYSCRVVTVLTSCSCASLPLKSVLENAALACISSFQKYEHGGNSKITHPLVSGPAPFRQVAVEQPLTLSQKNVGPRSTAGWI